MDYLVVPQAFLNLYRSPVSKVIMHTLESLWGTDQTRPDGYLKFRPEKTSPSSRGRVRHQTATSYTAEQRLHNNNN